MKIKFLSEKEIPFLVKEKLGHLGVLDENFIKNIISDSQLKDIRENYFVSKKGQGIPIKLRKKKSFLDYTIIMAQDTGDLYLAFSKFSQGKYLKSKIVYNLNKNEWCICNSSKTKGSNAAQHKSRVATLKKLDRYRGYAELEGHQFYLFEELIDGIEFPYYLSATPEEKIKPPTLAERFDLSIELIKTYKRYSQQGICHSDFVFCHNIIYKPKTKSFEFIDLDNNIDEKRGKYELLDVICKRLFFYCAEYRPISKDNWVFMSYLNSDYLIDVTFDPNCINKYPRPDSKKATEFKEDLKNIFEKYARKNYNYEDLIFSLKSMKDKYGLSKKQSLKYKK